MSDSYTLAQGKSSKKRLRFKHPPNDLTNLNDLSGTRGIHTYTGCGPRVHIVHITILSNVTLGGLFLAKLNERLMWRSDGSTVWHDDFATPDEELYKLKYYTNPLDKQPRLFLAVSYQTGTYLT